MIFNHKEIKDMYKSDYQIKKAIENKEIYKIEKNLYSDSENINYLEMISKKYKNAIFTMDSAFYFHNLTDVILGIMPTCRREVLVCVLFCYI